MKEGKNDRGLNWKAVLIGALTDIAGSFAFASVVGILATFASSIQHLSSSEIEARLHMPSSMIAMMIISLAFTVLGGYVAGRISEVRQVLHGSMIGLLSLLVGLATSGSLPLWYEITSLSIVIPCGALGGWIAKKNRESSAHD